MTKLEVQAARHRATLRFLTTNTDPGCIPHCEMRGVSADRNAGGSRESQSPRGFGLGSTRRNRYIPTSLLRHNAPLSSCGPYAQGPMYSDNTTRIIPLADRNGIAVARVLIDAADYATIRRHRWYLDYHGYARTSHALVVGATCPVRMHRLLLSPPPGAVVDHINRDRLDNRRSNLRIVDARVNALNRDHDHDATSAYRGVSWDARNKGWRAQIGSRGRKYFLGVFAEPCDAALAYDDAARELHGEHAWLNFPDGDALRTATGYSPFSIPSILSATEAA